jgi:hypothetical protein
MFASVSLFLAACVPQDGLASVAFTNLAHTVTDDATHITVGILPSGREVAAFWQKEKQVWQRLVVMEDDSTVRITRLLIRKDTVHVVLSDQNVVILDLKSGADAQKEEKGTEPGVRR